MFVNIFQLFSFFLFIFEKVRLELFKKRTMEDFDKNEDRIDNDSKFREEIYSKAVRAGKRTYFFDVKSTRRDEFYLTITESKKRFEQDGSFHFEKHKIFLYKEDFDKFLDGLQEVMTYIDQNQSDIDQVEAEYEDVIRSDEKLMEEVSGDKDFTKIDFEAL